jgi:DDE superfamily endonuclease
VYNFHVSQLRIRIEMAFALLCGKWAILRKPLQVKLKNTGKIFMCCAILHNFVINERLSKSDIIQVYPNPKPRRGSYPSDYDDDEYYRFFVRSGRRLRNVIGVSTTRDNLVRDITQQGVVRPSHNVQRNS